MLPNGSTSSRTLTFEEDTEVGDGRLLVLFQIQTRFALFVSLPLEILSLIQCFLETRESQRNERQSFEPVLAEPAALSTEPTRLVRY
jgi:hypothetical protein